MKKTNPRLTENENIIEALEMIKCYQGVNDDDSVHSFICLRPAELQRADSWHHCRNAVQRLGECYSAHIECLYSKCMTHTHTHTSDETVFQAVTCACWHTPTHTHPPTNTHTVCESYWQRSQSLSRIFFWRLSVKLTECFCSRPCFWLNVGQPLDHFQRVARAARLPLRQLVHLVT